MPAYRFDAFELDPAERRLLRDGAPVEINARYLDALALLVAEAGRLVAKERFLAEVWRGVPVTDEALTQCVRSLRRALGDDAARPRFIETVPRHGYRFVAAVTTAATAAQPAPAAGPWRSALLLAGAGTLGAAAAGIAGGLVYGSLAAAQPAGPGAASVLLVLLWLTLAAALTGGAGVSLGIAAATPARVPGWRIAGGAAGGFLVGGSVKLLGLDAFALLLGRSPAGITGAPEGLLLGAAVGAGAWWSARRRLSPVRAGAEAAAIGAVGGALILLLGGRLMAGSLDLLAETFPGSRLRFALPEVLGPVGALLTGALEGALFAGGIVGAMTLAHERLAGLRSTARAAMSRPDPAGDAARDAGGEEMPA